MQTQFDLLKIKDIYNNNKNYLINNNNNNNNKNLCIIYFSGNGLYYPNNDLIFEEKIIKEDRYEWKKNISIFAQRIILIRDVYKQWYTMGVNKEINTIDKIYFFLKKNTENMNTICVGNSAGGYMAILMGCLLKSDKVFSFSGQISLRSFSENKNENLFLYENSLKKINKYDELTNIILKSEIKIYYFYAGLCKEDIEQINLISDSRNIIKFPMNSKIHGVTCYPVNFKDLIEMDHVKLCSLIKTDLKVINSFIFSIRVSGIIKTLKYLTKIKINKIIKLLYILTRFKQI
jgi:hypothetical protein